MAEWWTYSLSDFLLFSPRTYYRLFELYNAAIWPGQIAALGAGFAIAGMLWTGRPVLLRVAVALLAIAWLWVAWGYHYTRYATINWGASYLAVAFAVQAVLLVAAAAVGRFPPETPGRLRRPVGLGLLGFALLVQPVIGPVVGRAWSQIELFGIAPDPTVMATLGAALLLGSLHPPLLLPIPIAWCAISGATQWTMGSPDAAVMPAAGAVALFAALRRA